jgi:hypothetical protein
MLKLLLNKLYLLIMIITTLGHRSCGKSTIANYLTENHDFVQLAFADSVKDCVASMFMLDRQLLEGITPSAREWRETKDNYWSSKLGIDITPRKLLQTIGTDLVRNWNKDLWVFSLERKITTLISQGKLIVVTDTRFNNELEMLKKYNVKTIRIDRKTDVEYTHVSDLEWLNFDYDYQIYNNSTVEEFYKNFTNLISNIAK